MVKDGIKNTISVSVRTLVEFILRGGDIDNRKKSGQDVQLMLEGARIHRMIQQKMGIDYHAEVYLKKLIKLDDYDILIDGRADGIIYSPGALDAADGKHDENNACAGNDVCAGEGVYEVKNECEGSSTVHTQTDEDIRRSQVVIDEIKTMYLDLERLREPVPVHLAQAKCYAYMFAEEHKLKEITVRMTYVNQTTLHTKYFHETYTWVEIRNWFEDLIEQYKRWARFEFEFKQIRNGSIHGVEFPFEYREGQKELVSQVYRTIYHGRKLFLQASTGTGKTVSTVFPAVKAMGEGLSDRIFYLTAKTITRTVAAECFDILRRQGLRMKTVVITAKDKICCLDKPDCNPAGCERAKGHFDRVNDAMYDLLTHEDSFTREIIEEYSAKHCVCPFELCLDMSLFSDAVICDYNYVFDPNVYLRRFFADGVSGKYIFLVDEAHNLVERGMSMYSAELYKEDFLTLKQLLKEPAYPGKEEPSGDMEGLLEDRESVPKEGQEKADGDKAGNRREGRKGASAVNGRRESIDQGLDRALGACNRKLLALKRECIDLDTSAGSGNDIKDRNDRNYMVLNDISDFVMALNRLMARLENFLDEQEHFRHSEEVLDFYFKVRHFLNMFENMGDDDYRIYCERTYDGDFMLKLLCVNPSASIKLRLTKGVSTIFFSATLLPVQYYRDMLGAVPEDYAVYAHSIFDVNKRGLFIAADVSSKYTRRNDAEYYNIAGYISDICRARTGNYMVFFPSHAFLEKVLYSYEMYYSDPAVRLLVQKSSMNEAEREEFLSYFTAQESSFTTQERNDTAEGLAGLPFGSGEIPKDDTGEPLKDIMEQSEEEDVGVRKTTIGFCVMGGIFAEGIDLKNDSLIGAVIVGTGLPMVCSERKILKEAYETMGLDGFDYAYTYPGMNKVMQAAGRVIRTVDDVGIVALLDERFLLPKYMKLFPREWKNYERIRIGTAYEKAAEFWENV
ncbi:MAG: ATP-dependent DNA helicase [Lachnospiraceae bacterium]|nr:ATP-dependent DNA helicase [Lachnospiraceae bacterium]